jgi:PhnB protein
MAVKPIPEGYRALTPYLVVHGANRLLEFMKQAFQAEVVFSMPAPDGTIGHAEVKIGDSMLMLGEASARWPAMPAALYLYVPDCDAVYRRALEAGAVSIMEPADQFYGDRHGGVRDASGNIWWLATHKEDVPPDEIARRAAARGQA